ncbi:uncharacterized protein (TIGR02145 family) [Flavobacterium chryseum]|nr:uncharacterized protein (TIGR02145 family) [Flavobacterium sp. P3160]
MWLVVLAILFSINTEAQMTIGGKKAPEPFSVLELLNKGGLRLPQMTTAERNAFAVQGNDKGEGLTIYNKTTGCVEYWNKTRWVSLCEGTSQTTISPQPCVNVAADGTGCDQTFTIEDVDCPNGPFNIAIVAGGDYATLTDLDNTNGTFKIAFGTNNSINTRTVLVRVTSTCTSLYKEFLFSQNGIDCATIPYTVPSITPSSAALTLCSGGAVYLSVPANTANLNQLIWTRNGIEVARGVSYYVATQKGKYNISMGAVGCNTNAANERVITESGTATAVNLTALASNNGVLCGTNSVTLSATGSTGTIAWFQNGVEKGSGASYIISGDSSVGEWFAAVKDGSCYSKPSNSLMVTKSTATGQISIVQADVLVNGLPLNSFTSFCEGGSLDLSVANKNAAVTYTWYNGNDVITTNPFIVPSNQTTMSLRMIATDNSGAKCPAEAVALDKSITKGNTPGQPNIVGNATLCDGTTDLTIVPAVPGTYTYTWYKDGVKIAATTPNLTVTTPGVVYTASVTNATGCTSTFATKSISANVSSIPVLSWISKPATATFGATATLQTGIEFGPASAYTWTASNGATVTGSGASVTVTFPASGTDTVVITATAQNSCGKSAAISTTVTLGSACPTPVLVSQSALSQNVTLGGSVTETVSVTGGVTPSYQWYKNTTASTTGGTAISGATAATYIYTPAVVGTSYVYCIVTNGCTGNPTATSEVFTVTAAINPATIPAGVGTLSGRTCFDIAESNNTTDCGLLTTRQANKADFSLAATNTQTYTFTPSGTVSLVRFMYVESLSGAIIKTITNNGNPAALNVSGAVTATVVYQNSLSTIGGVQGTAFGKASADALTVDIYAVYNSNANGTGTDKQVKLTASVKDCACCGMNGTAIAQQIGANNYLTHMYGQDCWMVQNSKEGTPTYTTYQGQAAGENGYYYNYAAATTQACPTGWHLPTYAEYVSLNSYMGTAKTWWNTAEGNSFAGYYWGYWRNWLNQGFYAYVGMSQPIAYTYGGPSYSNGGDTNAGVSVRCVRNR